ncbi:MAG: fumarylacetoacetate hydrolase family protein [Clostridium sp.]|nr:fumarylacetoacetate hydrolase family protein [Clostridium sp.]
MARFVRVQGENGPVYGRVEGEQIRLLSGDLLSGWNETDRCIPLEGTPLLAPCQPGKIMAVGFNYRDHAEEFHADLPTEPTVFLKAPTSLAAPGQPVRYPKVMTAQVDYEAELVIVIGRRARHVPREEALSHVFGYTVGNDVTARDLQSPTGQWSLCKSFDTFAPIGPWIETELNPAAGLEISSWVNGQEKQRSNTRNLIFDVPFLVSYLSQVMTLEPGDLIFTGTPSGVGPVQPGDVMEMRIAGIGSLINSVEREE